METLYNIQGRSSILLPPKNGIPTVLLLFLILFSFACIGQVIVPYHSDWSYFPEDSIGIPTIDETPPPPEWKSALRFPDSEWWKVGKGSFGRGRNFTPPYGTELIIRNGNYTEGDPTTYNYPAFYFRKEFTIKDASTVPTYRLKVGFDDAIIIYINGTEVGQGNMVYTYPSSLYAGDPPAGDSLYLEILISNALFHNGTNLIAAEVHQTGFNSSDVYFNLELSAAPEAIPAMFRYPYLQLPSNDKMTVRWYTDIPSNSTIRYTSNPKSDLLDKTDDYVKEISFRNSDTFHTVTLESLTYNTKYYYIVGYYKGSNFMPLQNDTSATNFRTLPPPWDKSQPLRFWLLGDSGASNTLNPRPYYVRNAYLNYLRDKGSPNVDALLFLGDNSHGQGVEGWQQALDRTLFRFYNRPTDKQLLSKIPSWTVMGNHDYDPDLTKIKTIPRQTDIIKKVYHKQTAASFTTFAFPEKGEIGGVATNNKKGYYSFDQGYVHFVVLNPYLIETDDTTQMWMNGIDIQSSKSISLDNETNSPIDDLPQIKWLIEDLKANKKRWTVVTFHQPPFATIGHFSEPYPPHSTVYDKDLERIKEKLMPILEKPEYHVDLVLVSHSHAYQRAGMIRVTNNQTHVRTTDYTNTNNLGRYPATAPYIKKGNEQAYTYILSGSSGRGVYGNVIGLDGNPLFIDDGGYDSTKKDKVRPVDFTTPKMDNLTGNIFTNFYHERGGSVELLFRENRLDVKFIKEPDATHPDYFPADSFVVMKDVNKSTTINIKNGGDPVSLIASWVGEYHWFSSESPSTEIATGERVLNLGPYQTTTYYVRDGYGHLEDTFVVNVELPSDPPSNETLIEYNSKWIYPLGGLWTKNMDLSKQCLAPFEPNRPPLEVFSQGIIGFGRELIDPGLVGRFQMTAVAVSKFYFRRSFILNGSASNYENFKLIILMEKDGIDGRNFKFNFDGILINGTTPEILNTTINDLGNGRIEKSFVLSSQGFVQGVNSILIILNIHPSTSLIDPVKDPFTFDAQLTSTPNSFAPPVATRQFKLTNTSIPNKTICAGDSLNLEFSSQGNESGFNLTYQAELVTSTGSMVLGETTKSPISVRIPESLSEGTYVVKIVTKSAFMDQIDSAPISVNILSKATVLPTPVASLWRGQVLKLPVRFEGSRPITYILPDGSSGTSTKTLDTLSFKPNLGAGTYTLRSISNSCGTGTVSGSIQAEVKEPFINAGKVTTLTTAPRKAALCGGDSVSVAYTVIGPPATRTYQVELSDATGSFGAPSVVGSGTGNPMRVKLPAALSESDKYRFRILATKPDVDFTLTGSENIQIQQHATGSFNVVKDAVLTNEDAVINFNFAGSSPWFYQLSYGSDVARGTSLIPGFERRFKIQNTTQFNLDSLSNDCGYGTVSGSRTVTVSLVLSVDPLSSYGITVYPNPTSDRLLLKNVQGWDGKFEWTIRDVNGRELHYGNTSPEPRNIPEIDIRSLPVGTYFLIIEKGGRKGVWKFVKQ